MTQVLVETIGDAGYRVDIAGDDDDEGRSVVTAVAHRGVSGSSFEESTCTRPSSNWLSRSGSNWRTGRVEQEFSRCRFAVCVTVAGVIALGIGTVFHVRPWETATDRAHRLCLPCGLSADEVDRLIDDCQNSTLGREGLFTLWERTYADDPAERLQALEACSPCTRAILDVVGPGGD